MLHIRSVFLFTLRWLDLNMKRYSPILFFVITKCFATINITSSAEKISSNDSEIDLITLPNFEVAYDTTDSRRFKYGHKFNVQLSIDNSGTWETSNEGVDIWRLAIESINAYALKIQFNEISLPENSKLFIYNESRDMIYGPYTSTNINRSSFSSPLIKGDKVIIEYIQSNFVNKEVRLNINSIIHDYTDIFNFYNESRDRNCGENVVCDNAEDFRDQANSIIYMVINQYTCSASLINNVNNDNIPYVLTAWHCIVGETDLDEHNDFIYYFNHESPTCEGNIGSFEYSISGSTLLATRNENVGSDFALLVMDESPPEEWNPFYAGWSNDESAPLISVGIHHPEDYPRKINYDNDYAYSCAWTTPNTHWCLSWDDGGTASGSSGSPLFNSNKQIIGTNTGSDGPDCSAGPDLYGKFSLSWDGGNNSTKRLKDWLDPDDTGVIAINGIYTNPETILGDINSDEIVNIIDILLLLDIILDIDVFNQLADINFDNDIDIFDLIQLIDLILNS